MASRLPSRSSGSFRNDVLKQKFKKLHAKVIKNVTPAPVIDLLFQNDVLSEEDIRKLRAVKDSVDQCRELLTLLHSKDHPEAFIQLRLAIKEERATTWLVDELDMVHSGDLRLVDRLSDGPCIYGITQLANELYLLRDKETEQVEVYDVNDVSLTRCMSVAELRSATDLASCEHYQCLYIADGNAKCVHRLDLQLQRNVTRWSVSHSPWGLSITAACNVLVTCSYLGVRRLQEFSTRGNLLRQIDLQSDVHCPWHSIQLANGQFVVCHGLGRGLHRVCRVDTAGLTLQTYGGQLGSAVGELATPRHLAVDIDESVFVADRNNSRVVLLSPELKHVRVVVSRDNGLMGQPYPLHLDRDQRRLYVADNERDKKAGRLIVFGL